jgi:hypothetical protein
MTTMTRVWMWTSLVALLCAAMLHLLYLAGVSRVWPALIQGMLFGFITTMIIAVNYHLLPVFGARAFPFPWLIVVHWGAFTAGVLVAAVGFVAAWSVLISTGLGLQLFAALVFVANTVLLFVRGVPRAGRPPLPFPEQAPVDRLGTQATKSAGLCLPLALLLLLAQRFGLVDRAWVLAAEHLATLGWIMLMITGVAYHVLPRFSGRRIRALRWARTHLVCHILALALIVVGLGGGFGRVFALGGALMATALALFAWTVWPTLVAIRRRPQPISLELKERVR